MLEEIPIEPSRVAIFVGLAVAGVAVVLGALVSRRDVKRVEPNDVLRDP